MTAPLIALLIPPGAARLRRGRTRNRRYLAIAVIAWSVI
jgi:hypothetical protein